MYYKVTFEDGTEALAHHGVKGMHWGVRKAESVAGGGGGGGVDLDDNTDEDDITKIDEDFLDSDSLEAVRDFGHFLKLSNGNVAEAMKRAKQYNLGLKNVDAEKQGMVDQSRASKKAAFGEAGINPEWSREEATRRVNAQYEKEAKSGKVREDYKNTRSYKADMALVNSLPTEKERKAAASKSSAKSSDKLNQKNKISDEYKKEMEYNSKKNEYPSKTAKSSAKSTGKTSTSKSTAKSPNASIEKGAEKVSAVLKRKATVNSAVKNALSTTEKTMPAVSKGVSNASKYYTSESGLRMVRPDKVVEKKNGNHNTTVKVWS